MVCDDLYAVNTEEDPGRVVPQCRTGSAVHNGHLEAVLEKASWNLFRLRRAGMGN